MYILVVNTTSNERFLEGNANAQCGGIYDLVNRVFERTLIVRYLPTKRWR